MKKGEKSQVSVEPEKEKTVINVWRQEHRYCGIIS